MLVFGSRQQRVSHLMYKRPKWRSEGDSMLNTLVSNKIEISARMNGQGLGTLFAEASIETVLRLIELTTVGKRREVCDAQLMDKRDIELLERGSGED
jgi:hypothetical protein